MAFCRKPDCVRTTEAGKTRCRTCRRNDKRGGRRPVRPVSAMRILMLDIETSPNLAYVWGLWDQNVALNQIESTTEMICFAAKWLGEDRTMFWSAHEHGQAGMVQAAHDLLDEADAVMHFNGKAFDIKHLNREFLAAGLTPPAPYAQIDLLLEVRKNFKFPSNKLAYVSKALGLAGKVEHSGFDLWRRCMAGEGKAWAEMELYNRQDVELLEEMYHLLLPWLTTRPNGNLYGDPGCPSCGVDTLRRSGFAYTKLSRFAQYHCATCGGWFRASKRDVGVTVQQVVR